ncbi:MAG: YIP1 family protein [Calditrichaceae bacterium]|nr:YIP1 family protein [Calditrichaceae bacterium]
MESEEVKKPMSIMNKIINIFVSPREALEAIDEKPTWLVPFIIFLVFFLFMMFMTLDIQLSDQMEALKSRDLTEQQLEQAQAQINSPFRYAGFIVGPIFMLGLNALIAAFVLLAANLMIGNQEVGFKKIFSMVMWTGLVGILSLLLTTFLAVQKGTMAGVTMDLSILLPAVPIGESKTWLHHLLSRFDLFIIWQLILWVIGLSVMYKTTIQKAVAPILTLWIIWIVVAVGFSSLAAKFIPGM